MISNKVERAYLATQVSAVDASNQGGGAYDPVRLNKVETAGVFSDLKPEEYLALMVWCSSVETNAKDLIDLQQQLLAHCIKNQTWFDSAEYIKSGKYRSRLDGLCLASVLQFASHKFQTNAFFASKMQCSESTYRSHGPVDQLTYKSLQNTLHDQLNDWLHDGAFEAHNQSR